MSSVRQEWLEAMIRIVNPVLDALESGELKRRLPLEFHKERSEHAPLEAFGRSVLGLAPWLELETQDLDRAEQELQSEYRVKVRRCLAQCTDPESPDFMEFATGGQALVDTAFLAHALLRAPKQLGELLDDETRRNVAKALRSSRVIPPINNNWLFFSTMVEAGLYVLGEDYDLLRVLYSLRQFDAWYLGDGVYGDGPDFHWDYYNSFVIQPMQVDLVDVFKDEHEEIADLRPKVMAHATRYASILERLISPEGTYPIIGRSVTYRFGAFQLLSQMALQDRLAPHLSPQSVRSALTAVLRRMLPTMFDDEGWLVPGVIGEQADLAEGYINRGSLYLATALFLTLGLSPKDDFWSKPDEDWTMKTIWSGGQAPLDYSRD